MYTATVTIKGKTWDVSVATTPAERAAGLSGLTELAPNTGMLFDMGSNQAAIAIDMDSMNFNLDIVFISESLLVQGLMWEVEVGEQNVVATFPEGPGARYFLEMNVGELTNITFNDPVVITATDGPPSPPIPPIETGSLIETMMTMMIVVMMMTMMMKMVKGVGEPVEPRLLGGGKLPSGYEPVEHSIHGVDRKRLVDQYGSWAVGRAEAVCPEDDVECVRREAGRLMRAYRRGYGV